MESDQVLHLIMKKLKEHKANPLRSAVHEKARQKNLMKMFSIYTTLKRKERAKQRLKEQIQSMQQSKLSQQVVQNENQDCAEHFSIVPISNDLSTHDRFRNESDKECNEQYENIPVTMPNIRVDEVEVDFETVAQDEEEKEEIEVIADIDYMQKNNEIDNFVPMTSTPSTSTFENINNERITKNDNEESEEYDVQDQFIDQTDAIDGFLVQLGERLKKIPYKQRCKLEIEFLTRLYEVEEVTGVLDD